MQLKVTQFYEDKFRITSFTPHETAQDFIRTINIPSVCYNDPNLSPNQLKIIGLIYSFISNKKELFASNQFIADSIGVTNPRSVSNMLQDLEDKGYIKRKFIDANKRNRQLIDLTDEFILILHGKFKHDTLNNVSDTLNNETHDTLNNEHTKQVLLNKSTNLEGKLPFGNYTLFVEFLNSITGRKFKFDNTKAKRQYDYLVKQNYSRADFEKVIRNAYADPYHVQYNFRYLTPEFITRIDKWERYLAIEDKKIDRPKERELTEEEKKVKFNSIFK